MELQELIKIFRDQYKLFWLVLFSFLAIGITFQALRPVSFRADLSLNVTRLGKQETAEYKYDDFYRLQADERFADTVVRWLESPIILENIAKNSGLDEALSIDAQRLSSQYIRIKYTVKKSADAQKVSNAIIDKLNQETKGLNAFQKQENWFTIIGSDPKISRNEFSTLRVLLFSLMAGIFFGFWGMLVGHYFINPVKKNLCASE